MTGWIKNFVERTSWPRFALWFALLMAFSFWAFGMDSPWTRSMELAGGVLPETKPGIPALEPTRSFSALGADRSDYILWQALDISYAAMNFFVAASGIALGLKAASVQNSILRFLLMLPAVYVVCELIENTMLAAFATDVLAPSGNLVLAQQCATTLKFATGMPGLLLGIIGAIIAGAAALFRRVRRV